MRSPRILLLCLFSMSGTCLPQVNLLIGNTNLLGLTTAAPEVLLTTTTESSAERETQRLVESTTELIVKGEALLAKYPKQENVILVVGNAGAGKTTITKFVTRVGDLEAYDFGDRVLVRDVHGNGAESTNLVSDTIFPERLLEDETGTVFYDMPGFGDTRNVSVEIAQAWFMRRVGELSRSAKIVFVVNYSSLRTGNARNDLKALLESATTYIRNPQKFSPGICLIASKVEIRRKPEAIIQGLGNFLTAAKRELSTITPDRSKWTGMEALLTSFLTQDSTSGDYGKIAYFRQPEEVGPLTEDESVMESRPRILRVIHNNTQYVPIAPGDFGVSLSPQAVVVTHRVAELANARITKDMSGISGKIGAQFRYSLGESPSFMLGLLIQQQKTIEDSVKSMTSSRTFSDLNLQLGYLMGNVSGLNPGAEPEYRSIQDQGNLLLFVQSLNPEHRLTPRHVQSWVHPLMELVKSMREAVTEMSRELNALVQQATYLMSKVLLSSIQNSVGNTEHKPNLFTRFHLYSQHLNNSIHDLSQARTYNEFARLVQNAWSLFHENSSLPLPVLGQDVALTPDKGPSPFDLLAWIQPFHSILRALEEEEARLGRENEWKQQQRDIQSMNDRISAAQSEFQRGFERQQMELSRALNQTSWELEARLRNLEDRSNAYYESFQEFQARMSLEMEQLRNSSNKKDASCLVGSTLISTPSGSVPVDRLLPGSLVLNAKGESVRVVGVNQLFALGGSELFGFKDSTMSSSQQKPFFTSGHTFVGSDGGLLVQNKAELERSHPQMRSEFSVRQMPPRDIQLLGLEGGRLTNRTVPELTRGFADESEPLFYVIVEGDGTYIANGFVCYHELPLFSAWPRTFETIFQVVQLLPPSLFGGGEAVTLPKFKELVTLGRRIGSGWSEYLMNCALITPSRSCLKDSEENSVGKPTSDMGKALSHFAPILRDPWKSNLGLIIYTGFGSILHQRLDLEGWSAQPLLKIASQIII